MKLKILVTIVAAGALGLVPTASAVAASSYSEGFESGAAQNWMLTGLWNVNDCVAASGTYALVYNVHPQCNFDVGATAGTATTPPIVVDGPASFNFESYWAAEVCGEAWDHADVLVSVDNGPFVVVLDKMECVTETHAWQLFAVDLAPYEGHVVRIQFAFDSVDSIGNHDVGWAIDNVAISGAAYPTPELGSLALAGAGVAVVAGVALVNRRK